MYFIKLILRSVILSHLASAFTNTIAHKNIMNITLGINFLLTFIPALVVFIFSSYIMTFYGDSYDGLNELISIAVFTTVFSSISNVYSQAYMSKGMNWIMFRYRFLRDFGVLLSFVLFYKYFDSAAKAILYSQLLLQIIFILIMAIHYKVASNNVKSNFISM